MDIVCLYTGRGMAAQFQNVTIVNIYGPSGTERRRDKEKFFSNELPYLLRNIPPLLLVGGDFNCFLTNIDATGHPNYRGFDLLDMWETFQERATYTH
jgi:exonuclease III